MDYLGVFIRKEANIDPSNFENNKPEKLFHHDRPMIIPWPSYDHPMTIPYGDVLKMASEFFSIEISNWPHSRSTAALPSTILCSPY